MSIFAPKNPKDLHPKHTEPCPAAGPFTPVATTVEEFLKELEGLLVIDCHSFGCGSQNSRTIYQPIGCVFIYEDAHMPWNFLKPSTYVWWTGDPMSPAQAEACRTIYGCHPAEVPYRAEGSDEVMLYFDSFEGCVRWVWDHRKADLFKPIHVYLIVTDGEPGTVKYVRRVFEEQENAHLDPKVRGHYMCGEGKRIIPFEAATPEMLNILNKTGEG